MSLIYYDFPQGSAEWLECRRAAITGSKFKIARDYKKATAAQIKAGASRGDPSDKMIGYAMDVAREIVGGKAPSAFVSNYMLTGASEESEARLDYELRTGNRVQEVGFYTTEDGRFGVSVDGLVGDDGVIEIKTLVSSKVMLAVLGGDLSEYLDQCLGAMWLLGRKWVDLVLWAPDMGDLNLTMTIVRIERDDNAINDLENDLMAFRRMVDGYVKQFQTIAEQRKAA